MAVINDEIRERVMHVLFGNQKQASVQNEVVCNIVAEAVFREVGPDAISSEEKFVHSVVEFLNRCKTSTTAQDYHYACQLLVGADAANILENGEPCEVVAEPAGETTPKYYFFVHTEEPQESAPDQYVRTPEPEVTRRNPGGYREEAEELMRKMLPIVPKPMAEELADNPYAQALLVSKIYYSFGSNTGEPNAISDALQQVDSLQRQITELVRRGGDTAHNLETYFKMYKERLQKKK